MPAVGRRQFYTHRVRTQIKRWVAEGVPRAEIAKRLGTTLGSLAVTCSRLNISLTNQERRLPKNYILRLPEAVTTGIHLQAKALGWSDERLLSELIMTIQRDDLFEAVLDL